MGHDKIFRRGRARPSASWSIVLYLWRLGGCWFSAASYTLAPFLVAIWSLGWFYMLKFEHSSVEDRSKGVKPELGVGRSLGRSDRSANSA